MKCSRCNGHLVQDHLLDMQAAFRQMWATSWRCVNCGQIVDSVIEHHRSAHRMKALVGAGGPPMHDEAYDEGYETDPSDRPLAA